LLLFVAQRPLISYGSIKLILIRLHTAEQFFLVNYKCGLLNKFSKIVYPCSLVPTNLSCSIRIRDENTAKTDEKTPTTFVIIFCVEVETNKETSKSNIKIDAA
jgi:hypothetical protein